jgi:cytoskeletal protein RodZ
MDNPEQKKKFLILVGLLIAALLGVLIWYFLTSSNSDSNVFTSDSESTGSVSSNGRSSSNGGNNSFSQLNGGTDVELGFQDSLQDSRVQNIETNSIDIQSQGSGQTSVQNQANFINNNNPTLNQNYTYDQLLEQYNKIPQNEFDISLTNIQNNPAQSQTTISDNGYISVTDQNPNISTVDFGSGVILQPGQTGAGANTS